MMQRYLQERVIEGLMAGVLTPEGVSRWWDTEVDGLAGNTPRQALDEGGYLELLKLVNGYTDRANGGFT